MTVYCALLNYHDEFMNEEGTWLLKVFSDKEKAEKYIQDENIIHDECKFYFFDYDFKKVEDESNTDRVLWENDGRYMYVELYIQEEVVDNDTV